MANVLPDPESPFGARVRARLESETVVWLTTVGADGTPQPNPVWFLWEDGGLLVFNRPDAHRLAHIRHRPQVSAHFNATATGGDVVVFRGEAQQVQAHPLSHEVPAYVAKYGDAMARISGSVEKFGVAYPVAMRVVVEKVRGF